MRIMKNLCRIQSVPTVDQLKSSILSLQCPILFTIQHTCAQLLVLVILIITLVALVQSGRHGMKRSRIFKSGYYFTFGALRYARHAKHKRSQCRTQ